MFIRAYATVWVLYVYIIRIDQCPPSSFYVHVPLWHLRDYKLRTILKGEHQVYSVFKFQSSIVT